MGQRELRSSLCKSFPESQCLALAFGGLSPQAAAMAHTLAVGFPCMFPSFFSY